MGMAVDDGRDGIAVERVFKAAASQEREDLDRLILDRRPDRSIMQDGDSAFGPQSREGGFEFHRLVDRLLDEALDGRLTPGAERATPESAGKALRAGEPDPEHLDGVAVEHDDARVDQDLTDFRLAARLEVVIPEDGNRGDPGRRPSR